MKSIKMRNLLKEDNMNYYFSQLQNIDLDSEYKPKVVFHTGEGNGKTKFMELNSESIPVIIKWLKLVQAKQSKQGV